MQPSQKKKKPILHKVEESDDAPINEDVMIRVGCFTISIDATLFLYNKQRTQKQ